MLGLFVSPDSVIVQQLKSERESWNGGWRALNAFAAAATASHPLKIPAASMTVGKIKLGSPFTDLGSLKIERRPSSAMDHSAQQICRVKSRKRKDTPPAGAP